MFVAHFLVSCCCARHSSVEGILTCHSVMPVSLSGSTRPLSPTGLLSEDSAWPGTPDNIIKIFLYQLDIKKVFFWDQLALNCALLWSTLDLLGMSL